MYILNRKPLDWEKRKAICTGFYIVCCVLAIACLFFFLLQETNVLPNKESIKKQAKSQLEHSISNDKVTVKEIRFDEIETQKFRTRDEDPVGYFAYIEGTGSVIDVDGIKHENHLAYYRSKYSSDYDPESDNKWAYILTGTYTATHSEQGKIDGEFRIVYVKNSMSLCMVDEDHGASRDMLRQQVTNHVSAYVLAQYDIQKNLKVEITYIDQKQHNGYYTYYTVYGIVSAKDKYGAVYKGKFTAQYETNVEDQYLKKTNLEVAALTKAP